MNRGISLLGLFWACSFLLQAQLEKAPTDFVPRDCLAVLVVNNMRKLQNDLGRKEIIGKYPQQYQKLSKDIKKNAIYDLLSPNEWKKIGIDSQESMGFFLLSQDPDLVGFFFILSNRQKLRSYLKRLEKKHSLDLLYKKENGFTVIYEKNEPKACLVMHKQYLFFIAGDSFQPEGLEYVNRCVHLQKSESLAQDIHFQKTVKGFGPPSDIAVYFNIYPHINTYLREMKAEYQQDLERELSQDSQSFLDDLERSKGKAGEVEYWQYIVEKEKMWLRDRKEQEYFLPAGFLQSINGIALGLDVSKKSIQLKCHVSLEKSSPVYAILQSPKGYSYLLKQLEKPPMLMLQCAIHPLELLGYLQKNMEVSQQLTEIRAQLWHDLGIDLEDLLAVFDGEIALAVTGDLESDDMGLPGNEEECWDRVEVSATARLADIDRARDILSQIIGLVNDDENMYVDGDTIILHGDRDIHIAIYENYLIISSDIDIFRNLTGGRVRSFVSGYKSSHVEKFFHSRAYFMCLADIGELVIWGLAKEGNLRIFQRRKAERKIKAAKKFGMTGIACKKDEYGLTFEGIQIIETQSVPELVIWILDSLIDRQGPRENRPRRWRRKGRGRRQ